jgi:hypothetical protein
MLAAALTLQLFTVGLAAIDPGPATSLEMLRANTCRHCHAAEHAEWQTSRHGLAWSNPIFQREYRSRPLEWCVHCHAPLNMQAEEVRAGRGGAAGALAQEGVNCATCHVRQGQILAARRRDGSPHSTRVVGGFGDPAFCAGCHQFAFPRIKGDTVVGYTAHPMQDTVAQHERGPDADVPCTSCHARTADSPARHRFPGAHDATMLGRAIAVDVCREGGDLQVTVENRGAGHRVPTGDVHRHLVLRAWRPSAPERLMETTFGRRFRPAADGGKQEVADTTLLPRERRRVRWPLAALSDADTAADSDLPLTVELRYVYVIDEFPQTRAGLAEPSYAVVFHREGEPPACAVAP